MTKHSDNQPNEITIHTLRINDKFLIFFLFRRYRSGQQHAPRGGGGGGYSSGGMGGGMVGMGGGGSGGQHGHGGGGDHSGRSNKSGNIDQAMASVPQSVRTKLESLFSTGRFGLLL